MVTKYQASEGAEEAVLKVGIFPYLLCLQGEDLE